MYIGAMIRLTIFLFCARVLIRRPDIAAVRARIQIAYDARNDNQHEQDQSAQPKHYLLCPAEYGFIKTRRKEEEVCQQRKVWNT